MVHNDSLNDQTRRGKILRISLRLFAKRGYNAVSTNEIASAADCSQAIIMYHFRTKEQLWKLGMLALFRQIEVRNVFALKDYDELNGASQLRIALKKFVRASSRFPELGQIISREGIEGGPRMEWLYETLAKDAYAVFETIVARGVQDGSLKSVNPILTTIMIHGAAATIFNLTALSKRLMERSDLEPEKLLNDQTDALIDMVLNGLAG